MRIPDKHEIALIRHFQAGDDTLTVDGVYGPRTATALDQYIEDTPTTTLKMHRAWDYALYYVGKGGVGGNNRGSYIEALRRSCGFPVDVVGAWCAIFQSSALRVVGIPIKSRGAYTLCEKMANHRHGYELKGPLEPGKVYLACWKRGRWDTHQEAHVRMVRLFSGSDLVEYIGGNERGDKVRTGMMTIKDFHKDLIMVSGWS